MLSRFTKPIDRKLLNDPFDMSPVDTGLRSFKFNHGSNFSNSLPASFMNSRLPQIEQDSNQKQNSQATRLQTASLTFPCENNLETFLRFGHSTTQIDTSPRDLMCKRFGLSFIFLLL